VSGVNYINRHGNTIWFQEGTETRVLTAARNNITFKASTTEQAMMDVTWHGLYDGILHPAYATIIKPAHLGGVMALQEASFKLYPEADHAAPPNYHLLLKSVSIEFGNAMNLLDDANSSAGASGIHIGGVLDGAKVTFDVARPYSGTGDALTANIAPWASWFKNNNLLAFSFSLYGATELGVGISGVMQIEEPPSESGDGSLRRLSITGTLKESAYELEPLKITVYSTAP
jgi:hypothetical protein